MTKRLMVFAGVVALSVLQGCSSHTDTRTQPDSTATSVNGPSASSPPKVQNPLPVSVTSRHPCDSALTDAQLKDLIGEAPSAQRDDDATGPACGWQKTSTGATIGVGYMINVTGGIRQVYSAQHNADYQDDLEIEGYPALAYNPAQNPPVANCDVAVGINDSLAIDASFVVGRDRAGKLNPCDAAKAIAQDVLDNLKAAAR